MAEDNSHERAQALHDQGVDKLDAKDVAGALALFLEALAADRARPDTLYNVGLIYKYRRDWEHALRYNRQSIELRPDDESTNWNVAIAATALKDWATAREAWKRLEFDIPEGEGPIHDDFGLTPVRLNAFGDVEGGTEVVWARRLSPVTARIMSIPTPHTQFRFGDIVLHDGAGIGSRLDADGTEQPVFNVFELFEASPYVTYDVVLEAPDSAAVDELEAACDEAKVEFEDWTEMRTLCEACSNGTPHEQHAHHPRADKDWETSRRVGLASKSFDDVDAVLEAWCAADDNRGASVDQDDV